MGEAFIEVPWAGVRYLEAFLLAERIAAEDLMRLGILKGGDISELLKLVTFFGVIPSQPVPHNESRSVS